MESDREETFRRNIVGPAPLTPMSPAKLVVMVVAAIFFAEAVIMLVLSSFPGLPRIAEPVIDATLLSFVILPILLRYSYNPLARTLAALRLRESTLKRLASVPDDSPNPIVEIDCSGQRVIFVNRAGLEQFPELEAAPLHWDHPLLAGMRGVVEELRHERLDNSLDVLEVETGDPSSEKFAIYGRKIRYLADDDTIRLYTSDLTNVRELLQETERLLGLVNSVRKEMEQEHQEAEEIGATLLGHSSQSPHLRSAVAVEPCSKAGGDRAGYCRERDGETFNEWLMVLDASGHGKGAAKFQDVALGGLIALLDAGASMATALRELNRTLEKLGTGRFLVGNLWRLLRDDERPREEGSFWVMEYNIAQHPVMALVPGVDEVVVWEWPRSDGDGGSPPLGLFDDGLDHLRPRSRLLPVGSRIFTYSDGCMEEANPAGEPFGVDRLIEAFRATQALTPEDARREISRTIRRFSGGFSAWEGDEEVDRVQLHDDLAIAIVDVVP